MIQRFTFGLSFLVMLALLPGSASADKNIIYQYKDAYGATAFTKNLAEVPPAQRAQAKKAAIDIDKLPPLNVLTSPPEDKSAAAQSGKSNTSSAPSTTHTREYWQNRYEKAKSNRDAARLQLQIVQYNIRDNSSYGGPGMQERQAEYAKREAELKDALAQLDAQVNGGIAEEARRAGAPVEWYRDMTGDTASN